MQELFAYTENLYLEAARLIADEYNSFDVGLSRFQKVNLYLIDRALNENKNLYIKTIDADQADASYLPTVLSVAVSIFYKNYCDDETSYEVGTNLQKDGIRYRIVAKSNEDYTLLSSSNGGYSKKIAKKNIKKYLVINTRLSKRTVRTKLDDYKALFSTIFKVDYFPSEFKYKAVIVLEKSELEEDLKQSSGNIDLLKALPLQWVTKKGKFIDTHIPIQPMIYLVPDYETFREYILEAGIQVDAVVLIGKNKYREEAFIKIQRDLREEAIPKCIILGSTDILDTAEQFIRWRWTFPEYAWLARTPIAEIDSVVVENSQLIPSVEHFLSCLTGIEEEFSINLSFLKRLRRLVFSLVLPTNNDSRLLNHVEYIKHLLLNESSSLISEELHNQNADPSSSISQVKELLEVIFRSFHNEKLSCLSAIVGDAILVVPDYHFETWVCEFKGTQRVVSFKDFRKLVSAFDDRKKFVLLSLYGYDANPIDLVKLVSNTQHQFRFLCYSDEAQLLESIINRYFNELLSEYLSSDRRILSNLSFPVKQKAVKEFDLIEELANRAESESRRYEYSASEQVNYQLTFEEEAEQVVCDGSKYVLLHSANGFRKDRISNLRPGDVVRIYSNISRERLFDIAAAEDKDGRLRIVDEDSRAWKHSLLKYYHNRCYKDPFYSIPDLLKELSSKGLTIGNPLTITKWISAGDKEKFPHAVHNLIAIKELVKEPELDERFNSIKKSRRLFRSLMIALGRDLSGEVIDYLLTDGVSKGKILSKFSDDEIKTFIHLSAPLRTIKTIQITEADETD